MYSPSAPPKKPKSIRVFSGIRHFDFFALYLSVQVIIEAIIFISKKYSAAADSTGESDMRKVLLIFFTVNQREIVVMKFIVFYTVG